MCEFPALFNSGIFKTAGGSSKAGSRLISSRLSLMKISQISGLAANYFTSVCEFPFYFHLLAINTIEAKTAESKHTYYIVIECGCGMTFYQFFTIFLHLFYSVSACFYTVYSI